MTPNENRTSEQSPSSSSPERAHSARSALAQQSSKVVEDVKELGNIAISGAGEALHEVRKKGSEAVETGRERAHIARDDIESYVRLHPLKSLLIAAGVGAVCSVLMRR